MADHLQLDPSAPVQFVINGAAGSKDADAMRQIIESTLQAEGRRGELHFCSPDAITDVARDAVQRALATRTAVVSVGGDGTLNAVTQVIHAAGCPLGVVPLGTFNYFARTHGIPEDPAEAVRQLLRAAPMPVQVAGINDRVFLVNASLGLYPDLLEDREAFKQRFGRKRWIALVAACATLLRARRCLYLHIEMGGRVRDVQTLALFVGNNRLQLQQFGAEPPDTLAGTPGHGTLAALMLRPVGLLSLLRLLFSGAQARLGKADALDSFEFDHLVVKPRRSTSRRWMKVAFDGEVTKMRAPLDLRVLEQPLYLLKPQRNDGVTSPDPGTMADTRATQ
ncbi:diacylglycerol/lipid kinase family protein [Uliginosibacterium sp. H1]|uniref:diacylglycerol/lipid kinase family protein n=1 Tax=Uliginosibacterium sp. H1 TaxID=3114757 RepID=UPI002E1992AA|nr:diacylglycerol kinase family protein [Uliginosibacterium sp. H1]